MSAIRPQHPSCVIFDIGNVLYKWDPERVLAEQIPDALERQRFIEDADLFAWHRTLDGGRGLADAVAELCASFPDHEWLIARWGELYDEMVKEPIPGALDIVARLHERRVPLFVISNFPAAFWPAFRARHARLFERFNDVLVSGEVGLMKPDPAIFELAMRRFGLQPRDALFVDDMQDNIDAGAAAGLHTHRFETPAGLEQALGCFALL
jgi:2-haloacid dehalogenase